MKTITEEELIDYLAGELPPADRARVAAALAADPALAAELAELEEVTAALATLQDAAPSAAADRRFAAMLAEATQREEVAAPPIVARGFRRDPRLRAAYRRRLLRFAAVAAVALLVFTAGRFYQGGVNEETDRELAATRTLMLELMTDQRTSARIRATTVTLALPAADPVTTANLGYLLRTDASTNVRLAALDALRRFANDPAARDEMVRALGEAPPEAVRLELIETLVRLNEKRILPYLRDIMSTDSLPRPLRTAAEMASYKLI